MLLLLLVIFFLLEGCVCHIYLINQSTLWFPKGNAFLLLLHKLIRASLICQPALFSLRVAVQLHHDEKKTNGIPHFLSPPELHNCFFLPLKQRDLFEKLRVTWGRTGKEYLQGIFIRFLFCVQRQIWDRTPLLRWPYIFQLFCVHPGKCPWIPIT